MGREQGPGFADSCPSGFPRGVCSAHTPFIEIQDVILLEIQKKKWQLKFRYSVYPQTVQL
jgi:hypothetical protein